MQAIIQILALTTPYIIKLIKSYAIPAIKRKLYQKLDKKADNLIQDLAQNASKINNETDNSKKEAYIEGTKLGIETLRALGNKLIQASDVIEHESFITKD